MAIPSQWICSFWGASTSGTDSCRGQLVPLEKGAAILEPLALAPGSTMPLCGGKQSNPQRPVPSTSPLLWPGGLNCAPAPPAFPSCPCS